MTDPLPDIDRLLRLGPGHEDEVISAMVAAYHARLSRLACAILHDPADADDAVQQVFVSAALNLGRYQPGTNFRAWIYTLAVNACRGVLRRRKARQALNRLLGRGEAQTPQEQPEEKLLQDEASRRLWAAVERLDEKQRLVVLLRYQDGLAVHEIAQVLAAPEATIYTRLHEALRRLRLELAPAGAEPAAGVVWEKDATR